MSAVALGLGLGSLTHRGWLPSSTVVSAQKLRGNYITPHCPQCPSVAALKLPLVPVTASRPSGEGNRRYAKWPSLESVAQPSALLGRCAPLWLSWHCLLGGSFWVKNDHFDLFFCLFQRVGPSWANFNALAASNLHIVRATPLGCTRSRNPRGRSARIS
jgi:hypothetical protein